MDKNKVKKLLGHTLLFSMIAVVIVSFAFLTDKKEDRLGVGIASNTPPYIALEYDLALGESYVNIRDEDLTNQKIRVYEGDYQSNRAKINEGFKEPDYEFEGLKSTEDLRTKLGVNAGKYTVTATQFKGTGTSNNNKGLVAVPYFDSLGLDTTDLSGMFKGASSFNQDITSWDVSNVNNMDNMLEGATSFNHDLFEWNVVINSKPTNFNTGVENLPDYKLPKVWQDSYKVVFKDRGNIVKEITGGYYNRKLSETSRDNLDLPEEPVSDTHWFEGWESAEGIAFGESMVIPDKDVIYEAQWRKKTVEIDDGEGGKIEIDVDDEGNVTLPTLPDKEGADFDGWVDEDGNKVEGGTDVDYTEGDKYKPIWKPKEYTVTFRGHNNTILKTQTVNHGGNATAPSNPTRTNYTFTGWDRGFTNVTGNITVNAKWVISRSTFSYTGGNQKFNVVDGGKYRIEAYGAQGGNSGGKGGKAEAIFDLYTGDTLYINVGGQNGYNGGGNGSAKGGGATDVRLNTNNVSSRLITGAGGGGGSGGTAGGNGNGAGGDKGGSPGSNGGGGGSGTETWYEEVESCYNWPESCWLETRWTAGCYDQEKGNCEEYSERVCKPAHRECRTDYEERTRTYKGNGGSNFIQASAQSKVSQSGIRSGNGYVVITAIEPHNID